jgi:hypothetical protein
MCEIHILPAVPKRPGWPATEGGIRRVRQQL